MYLISVIISMGIFPLSTSLISCIFLRCLSLSDVRDFVQEEVSRCNTNSSDFSAEAIAFDRDSALGKVVKVCLGSEPEEPTCKISEHGT